MPSGNGDRPDLPKLNFIQDEPAAEDFFKSHSRVAHAVVAAVQGNPSLKVIGLLGQWGSGKSTAIKLIREALDRSEDGIKTYLFPYDAWLQQRDPPRRAFLESLIYFLEENKLSTYEKWREQLWKLTGRIEETEIKSRPSFTSSGRYLFISLLVVPLGMPLLGYNTLNAAFGDAPTWLGWWTFLIGLILTSSPIVVALIIYLSWRPKGWPTKMGTWRSHRHPHEKDSLLSLFLTKAIQTNRDTILRSAEPSAIEFQDLFREIMVSVAGDDHRFIFVVDNLDRIPEEEAVEMWSTIRSFFLGAVESTIVRKAKELPTVILPIDIDAVERMYAVKHGDNAKALAQSFMDKTFDLTFRVAQPVMSEWKGFLAQQFKHVFGDVSDEEIIHHACTFYEEATRVHGHKVTPRTINSLVNYIGTLWLQWRDTDVSFSAICYYACFRDDIDQDIGHAVGNPIAGIIDIDPNWQRSIAALHFGVEPETAIQILIEQPIRDAISTFDLPGFSNYETIPGFVAAVRRVVSAAPQVGGPSGSAADPKFLGNAARLLDASKVPNSASLTDLWRYICSSLIKSARWDALTEDVATTVSTLLARCEPGRLDQFTKAISARLRGVGAFDEPATRSFFVTIARALLDARKAAGLNLVPLPVPGPPGAYLHVLAMSANDAELMTQLATDAQPTILVQTLVDLLGDTQSTMAVEDQVAALVKRGTNVVWDPLIEVAAAIIESPGGRESRIAPALHIVGTLLKASKTMSPRLKSLGDSGHLQQRLNEAYAEKNDAKESLSLALLLLADIDFAAPGGQSWPEVLGNRPLLVAQTDAAIETIDQDQGTIQLIKTGSAFAQTLPVVRAIVSRRVQENRIGRMHVKEFIQELPRHLQCVEDNDIVQFIIRMSRYKTFAEQLANVPFEGNVLTILHALIKTDLPPDSALVKLLRESLESSTPEQWRAAIRSNIEPLPIAIAYSEAIAPLRIGANLDTPVHDMIGDVVAANDDGLRERWFRACEFLSDAAKAVEFAALRDRVLGAGSVAQLPQLLTAGGHALLESRTFDDKADDAVRHIVRDLVADPAARPWLATNASTVAGWVAKSLPATRKYLEERITELWISSDEEHRGNLETWAAAWSLAPPNLSPSPATEPEEPTTGTGRLEGGAK
jgi:hypothetical protein